MPPLHLSPLELAELRAFILYSAREGDGVRLPDDRGDPRLPRWLKAMIDAYVNLTSVTDLQPIPDMLPRLGAPGILLHTVACQTKACWPAFDHLVCRGHPEMAAPKSIAENEHQAASYAERRVLRALIRLPGIGKIDVHPEIAGLSLLPDLLVRAATGASVLVEVAGFVAADSSADRTVDERAYRARMIVKSQIYEAYDRDCRRAGGRAAFGAPVVIWRDELAPRALAAKGNKVLRRLGLPPQPPPPPYWFEAAFAGGIA